MRRIYTQHVRLRIRQRGLSERQIEETIESPDQVSPSFRGRRLAQKRMGNKTLEVVYKEEGDQIVIITAYWLDKGEE